MRQRPLLIAGIACLAVMAVLTAWARVSLPADALVPTHFNASGEVDATSGKAFGLLLLPIIALGVLALLLVVPRIDPRRTNLEQSAVAYNVIGIAIMVLFTGIDVIVVLSATGRTVDVSLLMSVGIGVLFIAIGAVLPRLRSSYLVGIRTPWTLTSELAWRKTHVLGAWLFVAFGLALVITGVMGATQAMTGVMLGGIVVVLVVTTVYSYVVWRSDPERHTQA